MATVSVRVSMWPDRDIEVDEDEVPWLRTQGILLEPEPEPATAAADPDPEPEPDPDPDPEPELAGEAATTEPATTEAPKRRRTKEA